MAGFDNGVSSPGGASYLAPLLSFSQFGDWKPDDPYQKVFNDQQQQLNQQRIQQGNQQQEIQQTFQGGLPRNADGSIDYAKAVSMLAQKGDTSALWKGADAMAVQNASKLSPMLANGPQGASPQGGQPQPPAQAGPAQTPASPKGDAGSGTIASLVTDKLPNQDATTGQTIAKVAQVMGVDPNAPLTPGQLRRAQGLVQKYAGGSAAGDDGNTFKDRFAAADGGNLPPSANAVSPAPKIAPAAPPVAPQGGGQQPVQQQPQQQPQGAPQAAPPAATQQAPQGQPIVPQVPLPKGFNDPQAAILALRAEAARLSPNPRARGQVDELNNWASRI